MPQFHLKVFISRHDTETKELISKLHDAIKAEQGFDVEIKVIDVIEHPDEAMANEVYATPMVMRDIPPPILKVLVQLDQLKDVAVQLLMPGSEA